MQVRLIRDDGEHREAIARLDALMTLDPDPDTPENEELRLLALVINDYEQDRWPIDSDLFCAHVRYPPWLETPRIPSTSPSSCSPGQSILIRIVSSDREIILIGISG